MAEEKKKKLLAKMAATTHRYIDTLPDKLATIEAVWTQLQGSDDLPTLQELHRLTHTLAGSGATFGFAEMGDIAREAEILCRSILSGEQSFTDQKAGIRASLDRLQACVKGSKTQAGQ